MIWVILAISVLVFIGGGIWMKFDYDSVDEPYVVPLAVGLIGTFGSIVAIIWLCISSLSGSFIDDRILVIQSKNEDVETAITKIVENYISHEGRTYEKMTPSEAVAFAVAYPELSSNELVKQQIETYKNNREQILNYEQQKVDKKIIDWWLHF